ncbi:glycosyltransferase family 2 protein [Methylobacterium flocculans]|uniref:glycosyltransferase family 2 protein n=1 Tax=Methylobacterium flocculans TaxID=2984843 RepID=UPI0021F2B102|nr:glycosyltransferase family 2 protein [Methylobacterium sp. FF17]
MTSRTHLTIIVPTLNEERYVARTLICLSSDMNRFDYEILVVDGGSRDRTVAIVRDIAKGNPRIRLIHNEKRVQSAAVNLAVKLANPRSEVFIRADCHAEYPKNFVEVVYDALLETGASSVVVPMTTIGAGCRQIAIAAAQNSRLGNGGSLHRLGHKSLWVEHGHHAAFRREVFVAVGGYDESFTHNEDAEFDVRHLRAGGKIWMESKACLKYFPRGSFTQLAKQYFKYGTGRAKNYCKHRQRLNFRQLLPVIVMLICAASLIMSAFLPYFILVPVLYVVACLALGAMIGVQQRSLCAAGSGLAAVVMHMSWAIGFLTCLRFGRKAMNPFSNGSVSN